MKRSVIAVFDSGLGGLTVLRALRGRLPKEDFFYFADTRFLPYGDRPEVFLKERGVLIARALVARGAKALVIACNTATAAAAEEIRAAVTVPVVAMEPGIKPAAAPRARFPAHVSDACWTTMPAIFRCMPRLALGWLRRSRRMARRALKWLPCLIASSVRW